MSDPISDKDLGKNAALRARTITLCLVPIRLEAPPQHGRKNVAPHTRELFREV